MATKNIMTTKNTMTTNNIMTHNKYNYFWKLNDPKVSGGSCQPHQTYAAVTPPPPPSLNQ